MVFVMIGNLGVGALVPGTSAYVCHGKLLLFFESNVGMKKELQLEIAVEMLIIQSLGKCSSVSYRLAISVVYVLTSLRLGILSPRHSRLAREMLPGNQMVEVTGGS